MSDESKTHHDLKNAALGIRSFIKMAKELLPNDPETEEAIDTALRAQELLYAYVKEEKKKICVS